ncbi:hypothetical protein LCGC14_1105720 [marine sediment metagenome]|uniref:Uncharacterized protein n=1 Tax=marine sediment metagenome TaxID=412755 RepID=A0A0F9MCX4_9ZZZZ
MKILSLLLILLASTVQAQTNYNRPTFNRPFPIPQVLQPHTPLLETYRDRYGNTQGRIQGRPFKTNKDRWGNTQGTIRGRSFSCTRGTYGNQTCNYQ